MCLNSPTLPFLHALVKLLPLVRALFHHHSVFIVCRLWYIYYNNYEELISACKKKHKLCCISLSVPKGCNYIFTTNFGSIFLNDVTIFPHELFIVDMVDFEVVGTLWFCFEEALKFAFIDKKKSKRRTDYSRVSDAVHAHQIDMAAGSVL